MSSSPKVRRKRRGNNSKGRSDLGPPFVQLWKWIIKTDEFAELTGSELKLLIDIASQFNGRNNGNLTLHAVRSRWKSRSTTQSAKDGLLRKKWIVCTKHGGYQRGPDLFAVTWWPIDECDGKHECEVERSASNAWQRKKNASPETGN
jgi:hypothetical protein